MKKITALVFLSLLAFSVNAIAQLSGAVAIGKKDVSVQKEERILEQNDQENTKVLLKKKIKKQRIWDNPRFVKNVYSHLNGRQKSIEKVQQKKLEEGNYATEAEKQADSEQIKSQALVRFDDYNQEPQELHLQMNENPRDSLLDLTSRISYIDEEKMTSEYANHLKSEMDNVFEKIHGVSSEEYTKAYHNQLQEQDSQKNLEKENAFPPLSADRKMTVEKLDDQSALLQLSVKIPETKK